MLVWRVRGSNENGHPADKAGSAPGYASQKLEKAQRQECLGRKENASHSREAHFSTKNIYNRKVIASPIKNFYGGCGLYVVTGSGRL
jgi:hypothetical protein